MPAMMWKPCGYPIGRFHRCARPAGHSAWVITGGQEFAGGEGFRRYLTTKFAYGAKAANTHDASGDRTSDSDDAAWPMMVNAHREGQRG
jgi:hypothetical protein